MLVHDIVNVKTPLKYQRVKDIFQDLVVAGKAINPKLEYLNKFFNWLDTWSLENFPHKLTSQTHTVLTHNTCT